MQPTQSIAQLRSLMKNHGIDAWIVPSTDPHGSEYVSANWRRRAFISGFTGSAGTVVVTAGSAGLWTDSRYFLQAQQQLQGSGIHLFKTGEKDVPEWQDWLADSMDSGQKVGLNPSVFSVKAMRKLAEGLEKAGIELLAMDEDLVDHVWGDARPPRPSAPVRVHPEDLAGESVESKLTRLVELMEEEGVDILLLSSLDQVAWTFNLRGSDIAYNPLFLAYALVEKERAGIFTDLGRLGEEVGAAMPRDVYFAPYEQIFAALGDAGANAATVWLDPESANARLHGLLDESGAGIVEKPSPVTAWKAVKNEAEIAGIRSAHLRDGAAMVRFLRWLYETVPQGGVSELTIDEELARFRSRDQHFVGPSFETIAGYGPHGAIVHYAATPESNAEIKDEGILLVDSGGQYLDGTTDITRTIALGEPTREQLRAYTAVLKGHLRLARAVFLEGTDGFRLDLLARSALWEQLLSYGHGTGHGVGAYLCVHEGPFSVSQRGILEPLKGGNILSNEPGYYKEGEFGIRIENLVLVVPRAENEHGRFLAFEDLTMCPYDRRLIDLDMLEALEREQVDSYHRKVFESLSPMLDGADLAWLEAATRPL